MTTTTDPQLEAMWRSAAEGLLKKPDDRSVRMGPEQLLVLVTCRSERQQGESLERFRREGLECRALVA